MVESDTGWVLAVDFGTTATAAVTGGDGQVRPLPLALDGAGRMSSSVYAPKVGPLEVGQFADHDAGYALDRYEPTPKRKIDRPWVRLGETRFTPTELIAGILERVLEEAVSQHAGPPGRVVLTHPVAWEEKQQAILGAATRAAADRLEVTVPEPEFVPEPVAAAHWYAATTEHGIDHGAGGAGPPRVGDRFAVYDLGGGTFDTTVLERTTDGFAVVVSGGIDPLGGYDFDHRLFTHLGEKYIEPAAPQLWAELSSPNPARVELSEQRRHLQTTVRLLKEALSKHPERQTILPGVPEPVMVTRDEFDDLIAEDVDRTITTLRGVLEQHGLSLTDLTAIYRVGGASRTPLVGNKLAELHVDVRAVDDPKLVVAQGATLTPREDPRARTSAAVFGRGADLEGRDDPAGAETAYREVIALEHPEWAPRAAYALGHLHHTQADSARKQARVHDEQASAARDLADKHAQEARTAYRRAVHSTHPTWAPQADTALTELDATPDVSPPPLRRRRGKQEPMQQEPAQQEQVPPEPRTQTQPAQKSTAVGPTTDPQDTPTITNKQPPQANTVETKATSLDRPPANTRTLGRRAWICVLAGVAILTVAMVACLLPWRGEARSILWGPVAALAAAGAVLVTIGVRDRTRAGRGWFLTGVASIAAAVALILCPLLDTIVFNHPDREILVSAALAIVGLALILAPQRRRSPRHGAVIAMVTTGAALVFAAISMAKLPYLSTFLGSEHHYNANYDYYYYHYGDYEFDCRLPAFAGWSQGDCSTVSTHVLALLAVPAGTG
ncbi:Hsp70 family protein, partial [Streptomyces sp. NPDC058171]